MVDYHPFSDAIFDDPYPIYKRLRDESPIHYLEEFDCWFVSRFEDVWSLEQDQRNLTSKFGTTSTHLVTKQTPISPNLSGLDPPHLKPGRRAPRQACCGESSTARPSSSGSPPSAASSRTPGSPA